MTASQARLNFLRGQGADVIEQVRRNSCASAGAGDGDSRGHGPRKIAVVDLGEDAAAECRLRAAIRHHGVPHRREDQQRLLRGAGCDPRRLSGDRRALQGLHLDPESEWLPQPAHRGHAARAAQPEDRGADPHARHARDRRERRGRALVLQAGRRDRRRSCSASAGCRICWRSSRTPQHRTSSSRTPGWNSIRTRCSASRRRAS